jgi:sugar phosphate isomerase/epimerase
MVLWPLASQDDVVSPKVTLSTASTFPESTAAAFEMAARLGYDGLEVMVLTDAVSQDPEALLRLRDHYGIEITSIHAPCLLISQRVWGSEPWLKLQRAQAAAELLGASTVVVHPPFRWQRDYARDFVAGIEAMASETDVHFAVENMFPWKAASQQFAAYLPSWDVRDDDYRHTTLDLSHTSVSGSDALEMARDLGDRLVHVHLADGSGSSRDEHLVPGRGTQPCAELLQGLAASDFDGQVVVEISTRKAVDRTERESSLTESLEFARRHLGQLDDVDTAAATPGGSS